MNNKKVCLNESCEVYGRNNPITFQENFKHCPFCGGKMVTFDMGIYILKNRKVKE